jgi:hypothetical protein
MIREKTDLLKAKELIGLQETQRTLQKQSNIQNLLLWLVNKQVGSLLKKRVQKTKDNRQKEVKAKTTYSHSIVMFEPKQKSTGLL